MTWKRYKIEEAYRLGLMIQGKRIRTNGSGFNHPTAVGIIGEVNATRFYFHQNADRGSSGSIRPEINGFIGSWEIPMNTGEWIEFEEDSILEYLTDCKYIGINPEGKIIFGAKTKEELHHSTDQHPECVLYEFKKIRTELSIEGL